MLTHTFKKQRAIGLLELMLALVVIVSILLLATRYYLITERNERVAKGATMINNIIDASTRYAEGVANVTQGLSMQTLIETRLLNENYLSSPWARSGVHDVNVIPFTGGFIIYMANIPHKECNNLLDVLTKDHPELSQKCDQSQRSPYSTYHITYPIN